MKRILAPLLLPALLVTAPVHADPDDVFEFGRFEMPAPPLPPMAHHGAVFAGSPFTMPLPGDALPADPAQLVMLAQRLELTTDQRQAFGRIMDETAPKLRDLMFRMQDTRKELDQALEDQADDAALRRLADTQGKQHADLLYLQLSTRAKLRALLTDEQREELEDGGFGLRGPLARLRALHPRRTKN